MQNRKKVIIVGAGVAGIASAIELAESGIEVHIIESRSFIGGRMYSFQDDSTGEWLDNGQHIMIGAYENFFRILKTLGTSDLIRCQKKLSVPFIDIDGIKSNFSSVLFPGMPGLVFGFLRMKEVVFKSRINAIKLLKKIIVNKIEIADKTVKNVLKENNQRDDIIKRFWEPLSLAVLNSPPELVSAKLLTEVLKKATSKGNFSACLCFPKVPLSELIEPFKSWLELKGGKILYRTPVDKILIENHNASVLLINGEHIEADAIISCVPHHVLIRMLPGNLKNHNIFQALNLFNYSAIISIYLWLNKEIIQIPFMGMLGTTTQWIFNKRILCRADEKAEKEYLPHYALTISGAYDLTEISSENIAQKCFSEIKKSFNFSDDLILLNWKVIKEKRATFIASPEIESLRLKSTTPVKNFFLGGDWTDTGLPATLEGAALSGYKAAKKAIEFLNNGISS